MWLSIHSNDGHFKISICKLNYTSIHVLLLNVYRHKIIWNYPQNKVSSAAMRRGKTTVPPNYS